MAKTTLSLPAEVTDALRMIGTNLRTARLRRNMTLDEVAGRIGIHRETLAMAERGSPNVAVGTYAAALWVYGLLRDAEAVAAPDRDEAGLALQAAESRERARPGMGGMSDDF
jgi:transcriptional regulator with XRE-family HTH domain